MTSDKGSVIFRDATVDDAAVVARIVAMALGEDLLRRFCGDAGVSLLEEAARMECSQYSYKNALVAEVNGCVAGAAVGYDGGALHELRRPVFALMKKHNGAVPAIEEETAAGEFYVDSLGLLPEYRGCGLGRMLLEKIRDKAFADGFQRVGLLVDVENTRAESLYASIGFERKNPMTLLGHNMWHMQVVVE